MTRYYLNVHNALDAIDQDGIELSSVEDAYAEAIAGLRDILAQQVREGKLETNSHISILGENGERLGVVTFIDAVEVAGAQTSRQAAHMDRQSRLA